MDESMEMSQYAKINEKLIPPNPHLQKIRYAATTLLSNTEDIYAQSEQTAVNGESAKQLEWLSLSKKINNYEGVMDLSGQINKVMREYVVKRLPDLKKNISRIAEFSDEKLLNALVDNQFEDVQDKVGFKRTEVLMSVMSHVIKHIETKIYKDVLGSADPDQLKNLGLDEVTKNIVTDLMDTSLSADPLFIRHMAYSQLSKKPNEEASPTAFSIPDDDEVRSVSSLFPKESRRLSRGFEKIMQNYEKWQYLEGASQFKKYLGLLEAFYKETDTSKTQELQDQLSEAYKETIISGFPVILTPPLESYYKEPYNDPEFRVSLRSPEAKNDEVVFDKAKLAMAGSLVNIGAEQFSQRLRAKPVRSVVSLGSYGVNLIFKAVAQERPVTLLYSDEQDKTYDSKFPSFMMSAVYNAKEAFGQELTPDVENKMKMMSKMLTMTHEYGHEIYPTDSPEAARVGDQITNLQEIAAEIHSKALTADMLKKNALEGTREQWACATLASTLQLLKGSPPDDPYYYASVYSLNHLFDEKAAVLENDQIKILDYDKFYDSFLNQSKKVIGVFADPTMAEDKVAKWVDDNCNPNDDVKKLSSFYHSA